MKLRNQLIFLTQPTESSPKQQQRHKNKFIPILRQNQVIQKQEQNETSIITQPFNSAMDFKERRRGRNFNMFLRLNSCSDSDQTEKKQLYDFRKRKFPSYQLNFSQSILNNSTIDNIDTIEQTDPQQNIDICIIQPPQNSSRGVKISSALQKHNKKMMPSGAACNYNIQFMRGLQMTANRFSMQNQFPDLGLKFNTSDLEEKFYTELQKVRLKKKRSNTLGSERYSVLKYASVSSQSRYNTLSQNHSDSQNKIEKIKTIQIEEKQSSTRWVKIIDQMKNDIKMTQKKIISLNEELFEKKQEKKMVKQYLVEEKKRMDYDALFLTRILINDKEQRWKKKQPLRNREQPQK